MKVIVKPTESLTHDRIAEAHDYGQYGVVIVW